MSITREQVLDHTCALHGDGCTFTVGPRGGTRIHLYEVRRNGSPQTWVTRPNDFRQPMKYGFKQTYQLTPYNANQHHTAADCPALQAQREYEETQANQLATIMAEVD